MYALDSKKLPNTRYHCTFHGAYTEAKSLSLSKRSYAIRHVSEPANPRHIHQRKDAK